MIAKSRISQDGVRGGRSIRAAAVTLLLLAGCGTAAPVATENVARSSTESREALLTASEADIAARRFQLAYQRLARLDAAAHETPRVQIAAGEVLLGLNQPKEALKRFEGAQADEGLRTQAWQGMGLALMAMGDTTAAISQLQRAVEADPALWRSWTALGRAYDKEQRWDEASAAYDKGLVASPDSAVIVNNIGMSLLLQRRYPEAAAAFERAISLDPDMEMARANLRIALAWQGRYTEATTGLRAATRADALNNVGYVAMLRGDYRDAQRYFSQALEQSATYHDGAARNLEALRQLVKSKNTANAPQTADTPLP